MRSAESFIREVHRRAAELCRKTVKRQIVLLSGVNAALLLTLWALIGKPHRISRVTMAGTSLLDESEGGYLAFAILSFMLGAAITFFLRRYLKKYGTRRTDQEKRK